MTLADEAAYFGAVQDGVDSQQEKIAELRQQLAQANLEFQIEVGNVRNLQDELAAANEQGRVLRDAVMFAKDTTDRGEIAFMMQEALTATEKVK